MIRKCCHECFKSDYLQSIIISKGDKGDCDFCLTTETYLLDPKGLSDIFQNILNVYELNMGGETIEDSINCDFNGKIFSFNDPCIIRDFLEVCLEEFLIDFKNILLNPVALKKDFSSNPLFLRDWDGFVKEIKEENRFHIKNTLKREDLENLLSRLVADIPVGNIFYRARKSESNGKPIDKMGKPPIMKTINGRANPKGISYLYLASNQETTLYEARASLLDHVTVGEFVVNEKIEVLDIRGEVYNDIIQLAEADDLEDFLKHLPFIKKLDTELSRPYGNGDRELDYLPTQYISELIKSLGYKGILYNSSLSPNGYNLVLFDGSEVECMSVEIFEIKGNTLIYGIVS